MINISMPAIEDLVKIRIFEQILEQNTDCLKISTNIPDSAGVYFVFNIQNHILYIGETEKLRRRISLHRTKTHWFNNKAYYVSFVLENELPTNRFFAEDFYKRFYNPLYNHPEWKNQKDEFKGMSIDDCRIICTDSRITLREKTFFRIIYETSLRPFEVLNLKIEDWDREHAMVTAKIVKRKVNMNNRIASPSTPRTAIITMNTNEMIKSLIMDRKDGYIFVNENNQKISLEWFNERINYFAKLIGIQKIQKYYTDGRTLKLITCMALRESGEHHHDNKGGNRELSAVASDHGILFKERHYEKVGEDFEQVHESYRKFHPAFVEKW